MRTGRRLLFSPFLIFSYIAYHFCDFALLVSGFRLRFKNGSTKMLIMYLAVLTQSFWHTRSLTPYACFCRACCVFFRSISLWGSSARSSSCCSELQVHFSEIAFNRALGLVHPLPAFNHHFHLFTCFEFPVHGFHSPDARVPVSGWFQDSLVGNKKW